MASARRSRFAAVTLTLALAVGSALVVTPSHAWLGLLGKLGSVSKGAAGAAGLAGKGAATGAGAVVGIEAVEVANAANTAAQAGKAARAGVAAEGTMNAEQLAKASGLGKAVPDEIAAMLGTPGKTLRDVPDVGTRAWLGMPADKLGTADAPRMVSDYAKLLEGKPATGPRLANTANTPATAPRLPTRVPVASIPWHATELLARAAHLGHQGAQRELDRICKNAGPASPAACSAAHKLPAKT